VALTSTELIARSSADNSPRAQVLSDGPTPRRYLTTTRRRPGSTARSTTPARRCSWSTRTRCAPASTTGRLLDRGLVRARLLGVHLPPGDRPAQPDRADPAGPGPHLLLPGDGAAARLRAGRQEGRRLAPGRRARRAGGARRPRAPATGSPTGSTRRSRSARRCTGRWRGRREGGGATGRRTLQQHGRKRLRPRAGRSGASRSDEFGPHASRSRSSALRPLAPERAPLLPPKTSTSISSFRPALEVSLSRF
jgi:hypothetical protein